ncbi:hypothetical protein [Alteromonas sp. a30]|uniref:hypothetical protein n=1 Tax=Alteromonas sp. a30 TaxID=2730917 RepID=UPI002282884A|nr:hypothetical protein [Alteromonas sp. a30]MCY7297381.1 hypothetical protein [Alteromonas sp. a30]
MSMTKVVPNVFFKNNGGYCALHKSLNALGYSSRELADVLTKAMSELCSKVDIQCVHIPHWHQVTDDDARTLRNILKTDSNGKPKSQSREYDLLQYLSMCMQYLDQDYAAYVSEWCRRQELCLDELQEDAF